jgi:hypothetical protein
VDVKPFSCTVNVEDSWRSAMSTAGAGGEPPPGSPAVRCETAGFDGIDLNVKEEAA